LLRFVFFSVFSVSSAVPLSRDQHLLPVKVLVAAPRQAVSS